VKVVTVAVDIVFMKITLTSVNACIWHVIVCLCSDISINQQLTAHM